MLTAGRDARDAGMEATLSRPAAEQDLAVVLQAIEHFASTGEPFSINNVRPLLPAVASPVVGAAFQSAAKKGLIERTGETVQATHPEGHAHRVSVWRAATGSNGVANGKHFASPLTPEQERMVRDIHWALDAGCRGKSGIRQMTDARRALRQLLDLVESLTGVTSNQGSLL